MFDPTQKLTILEAQRQNLVEHLIFTDPSERLNTQYGSEVTAVYWMQCEGARIAKSPGRRCALVQHQGQIALFVNDVGLN